MEFTEAASSTNSVLEQAYRQFTLRDADKLYRVSFKSGDRKQFITLMRLLQNQSEHSMDVSENVWLIRTFKPELGMKHTIGTALGEAEIEIESVAPLEFKIDDPEVIDWISEYFPSTKI